MARVKFTAGRVRDFACPDGKSQTFLWDTEVKGLGIRTTANGSKSYIFQSRLDGRSIRLTIGSTETWPISTARQEARQQQMVIDKGRDPRDEKQGRKRARIAKKKAAVRYEVTVKEAWDRYIEDRREHWSARHYADHVVLSQPGGTRRKRGKGRKKPGPLARLMNMRLADLDQKTLETWLKREAKTRPARARLSFALMRAFIHWCSYEPAFKDLCSPGIFSGRIRKNYLPRQQPKSDCLQREQLPGWFKAVRGYHNPVISSYLQMLLLIGSRPGELIRLQWTNLDFTWNSLIIKDKVEGERTIPLCPYVGSLLASLPRRNRWVFSSQSAEFGRIWAPREAHVQCLVKAGIDGLTIHGLRRSFGTLSEWCESPVGVVAQIMGHKPSAIAEKHYRQRPLDLLRMWHVKIEKWILEQAGIKQPAVGETGLRVVGE